MIKNAILHQRVLAVEGDLAMLLAVIRSDHGARSEKVCNRMMTAMAEEPDSE